MSHAVKLAVCATGEAAPAWANSPASSPETTIAPAIALRKISEE
jgi:hypothetical protein